MLYERFFFVTNSVKSPDFTSHVSVPTYAEFLTRGVSEGWGHDACLCSPAWSWMRKLLSCLVQHTSPLFSVLLNIMENSFYQPCYTSNSEQNMCWKCIVIGRKVTVLPMLHGYPWKVCLLLFMNYQVFCLFSGANKYFISEDVTVKQLKISSFIFKTHI